MSVNEKMTAIADNIRDKTGGTEALSLDDMASGVNEVYEAGKQAEYDAFWDNYQHNGKGSISVYGSAFFGNGWNSVTFKPKYDIIFSHGQSATKTFYRSEISNIHKILADRGLKIIIGSNATDISSMFELCSTSEVPPLETAHCTNFNYMFSSDGRNLMRTIHKINMTNATKATSMFVRQGALKNITFEGEIPISLSFSYSPLTVESMKNIITHLKDYSGTESEFVYTVTFKASAFAALEAEGSTSPNGNTWTEYIDDLKWNLELA